MVTTTSKRDRKRQRKILSHREQVRRFQTCQADNEVRAVIQKRRYKRLMFVSGMLIDELVWRQTRTGEDTTRISARLDRLKLKLDRYHRSHESLLSFTNCVSRNLRRLREVTHG